MENLPQGTVLLLFADIEDPIKLWERHPEAMNDSWFQHNFTPGEI